MSTQSTAETQRKQLWSLLGDLPVNVDPCGTLVATTRVENATVQQWSLHLNGIEDVPATLVVPDVRSNNHSAVIYMHTHSGDYATGREELFTGIPEVMTPFAPDLIDMGIVTLAIDSWCFGERQRNVEGRTGERETFCEMLWKGQVLFGMMLFDLHQALTWLLRRDDIERVGVLGMSMGATQAWWLAALDERVTFCADICCLTDFEALIANGAVSAHGIYYFIPSLLKYFSSSDINALVAPRPRLSLNGSRDPLTPVEGLRRISTEVGAVYEQAGAREHFHVETYDCGHVETPEMRARLLEWMSQHV